MFKRSQAIHTLDAALNADHAGIEGTWNTPVQFDASLVEQLIAEHDELHMRFTALAARLGGDPNDVERAVRDCADRLHKVRHTEALRLYPVIARRLSPDPIARRLFWQSRLVMLGLARRLLRRFDELIRAVRGRNGTEAAVASDHVANALAEYRKRNEAEMYPLYLRVGPRSRSGIHAA